MDQVIKKVEEQCSTNKCVQTQFEEQLEDMLLNGDDCHTTIHEEEMPVLRDGSSKQGSSGLCEPLKPVKVMKLEELDKETVTGSHTEAQILAGVATEKPGSFEDVEKQIKLLEKNISEMLSAFSSLKMEIGWLRKMTTMKW